MSNNTQDHQKQLLADVKSKMDQQRFFGIPHFFKRNKKSNTSLLIHPEQKKIESIKLDHAIHSNKTHQVKKEEVKHGISSHKKKSAEVHRVSPPLVFKKRHIMGYSLFFFCIYLVFLIKFATLDYLSDNLIFGTYSILVSFYILSRFGLSYFHEEPKIKNNGYEPTVSFAVPSKNEEENIYETIIKISEADYPKNKFDIIVINDGSTDNTLKEMLRAKADAEKKGVKVKVIDWEVNKGKREGMAECVLHSDKELILFIDSDSFIEPHTTKQLVRYFQDKDMAAVAGHAYVANANKNFLTKMQSVRYYVAFKAYKASESLFGSVTCCSGCCSAYRRDHLMKILHKWRNQMFLGVRCTYGDDRSLTNYLLAKGYKTAYCPSATVHTFVPDTYSKFMKQQLRWKKSWFRENIIASKFLWKKHPIMSISFYLSFILPIFAPIILFRAMIYSPIVYGTLPWIYIIGLFLMAFVYGLYYHIHMHDKWRWIFGAMFCVFYSLVLIWQLPWAILTIKDSSWGTR